MLKLAIAALVCARALALPPAPDTALTPPDLERAQCKTRMGPGIAPEAGLDACTAAFCHFCMRAVRGAGGVTIEYKCTAHSRSRHAFRIRVRNGRLWAGMTRRERCPRAGRWLTSSVRAERAQINRLVKPIDVHIAHRVNDQWKRDFIFKASRVDTIAQVKEKFYAAMTEAATNSEDDAYTTYAKFVKAQLYTTAGVYLTDAQLLYQRGKPLIGPQNLPLCNLDTKILEYVHVPVDLVGDSLTGKRGLVWPKGYNRPPGCSPAANNCVEQYFQRPDNKADQARPIWIFNLRECAWVELPKTLPAYRRTYCDLRAANPQLPPAYLQHPRFCPCGTLDPADGVCPEGHECTSGTCELEQID